MLGFNAEWESGEIEVDGLEVTRGLLVLRRMRFQTFFGDFSISWKLIENFIKNRS